MTEEKKTSRSISIHQRKVFGKDETVMRQGDKGNHAYLIQSGKVAVYVENGDKKKEVAQLGPGEIFGEMALVVDEPRTATVVALQNTSLIIITRPMMIEKLAKTDTTIKAIVQMMMKRIVQANKAAVHSGGTIEDMIKVTTNIYDSIHEGLPATKKRSLEKAVKPKLDEFIKAAEDFWKLYED